MVGDSPAGEQFSTFGATRNSHEMEIDAIIWLLLHDLQYRISTHFGEFLIFEDSFSHRFTRIRMGPNMGGRASSRLASGSSISARAKVAPYR